MFIRRTQTRSTTTGKAYFTHRLVRSERVGDKVRQRTLLNLGRHFDAAQSDWPALCRRIEEVLGGQLQLAPDCPPALVARPTHRRPVARPTRRPQRRRNAAPRTRRSASRCGLPGSSSVRARSGSSMWDCGRWTSSGCARACTSLGIGPSLRAAAIGSIIARMARPGSERATRRWLAERSALDELLGVDFQTLEPMQLYRASDALMAHREAIEHHLFDRAMDLFDLHPTVTLYDLTNTYFEGEAGGQPKARRGHSKEKRTDCPLLTLGLVLDASGFVRRSQVFAGNVREHHTLAEMLDALNAPRAALVVMDRGIATEDRVQWLREHGYHYLVVSRERTRHFDAEAAVRIETASSHGVHLHKVLSDDAQEVRLYCFSEERAAKERGIVERFAKRFEDALTKLSDGPVQTAYSQTPRQGLAAHRAAQSSKPRRRPALRLSNSTPTTPDNAPRPCASLAARSPVR